VKCRATKDRGVALIAVLLVMLILMVMVLGFYFVTTGEQKIAASDRDNTIAYYGALGALEKMSSDLAAFFVSHASPTPPQIDALTGASYKPTPAWTPGVTFNGGYAIGCTQAVTLLVLTPCLAAGPTLYSNTATIAGTGPLQGLQGIITPFTLTVIADGPNNTEVKMTRVVQEVAVPVFQFGIFSDSDLSFFAGPPFGFGGRTATNGNLFLAEGVGNTLNLEDRVTAAKDIIRTQLSNGYPITPGSKYDGTVDVLTTPGGCPGGTPPCRALGLAEGGMATFSRS